MAKAPREIRSLARSHSDSMVKVLAGIANEPSAPHSARVSAAIALLDRGWGKPAQTISGDPDNPLVTIKRIERVIIGEAKHELIQETTAKPTAH